MADAGQEALLKPTAPATPATTMIDQSVPSPETGLLRRWPLAALAPRTAYASVALLAAVLAWRIFKSEGGWATQAYAALVCLSIGALTLVLTRRVLVAAAVVALQAAAISIAATLKLKYLNMVLHAYDIVFYLTSASTMAFLWDSYRALVLIGIAGIATIAMLLGLIWRVDPTRVARPRMFGPTVAVLLAAAVSSQVMGERRHSQFEYEGMYLTSFYISWSETLETLRRGQLIEAAPPGSQPLFDANFNCTPAQKPPHIILIHHESIVPPGILPGLSYDTRLDEFFKSDDGKTHPLRVETYGGNSTMTEFSVLTGLSTYAFGGMRQFVQQMMTGKIKDTLPQMLARCGYRTVIFYPMLKSFVSAEKFLTGIGLSEIIDLKDQKATRVDERDSFYYGNALDDMARHFASSKSPLFTFVETMATHWPYDTKYAPEEDVPGGGAGTHTELNEYLRRLWLAHQDYRGFASALKTRFPSERFLVVRYGDHHPMATRVLLGYKDGTEAEDVAIDRDSIGYQTFLAINGVNLKLRPLELPGRTDVPYLAPIMMRAARLPLPESYKARLALMKTCDGRWFDCRTKSAVLALHRRLLDSGLIAGR